MYTGAGTQRRLRRAHRPLIANRRTYSVVIAAALAALLRAPIGRTGAASSSSIAQELSPSKPTPPDMKRRLTMRQRWQWVVALAAVVVVAYLLLPLWAAVVAVAFMLAFAVPPLIHSGRRRVRR